jgi:hypothetical protein
MRRDRVIPAQAAIQAVYARPGGSMDPSIRWGDEEGMSRLPVMPAQAGIHAESMRALESAWTRAFVGVTRKV